MANIVEYFMLKNTTQYFCKASYVVITLLTIGRAVEAGHASWAQSFWNSIHGKLFTKWNEQKTRRQSMMNFFPDFSDWRLDIYFLFAGYFILGAGSTATTEGWFREECEKRNIDHRNTSFMFTWLIKNCNQVTNDAIKEFEGKVEFVPADGLCTAKSLRYGALQTVYACWHN